MDEIFITKKVLRFYLLSAIVNTYTGVVLASLQNNFASGCTRENIKLSCPLNHKIAVKHLFFGVKKDQRCSERGREYSQDCCQRTHGDCLVINEEKFTSVNIICSGERECDFDAKKVHTRGGRCEDPIRKTTDYMTVIYNCIPEVEIAEFCTNDQKQGKELYLSNKNYPSPIRGGNYDCRCVIKTGFSQGLSIAAIDVLITRSDFSDVCQQKVRILDVYGQNRVIQCGHQGLFGYRIIYDRMVSNVTLELVNLSPEKRGYMWFHVKSQNSDDVSIYCGESIASLVDNGGRVKNTTKPSTLSPVSNGTVVGLETPHLIPDMIAIIGGISAAIALIFLVCIVAIAVHCTRMRENRRMPKLPEVIPSPMLRGKTYSSGDSSDMQHRYNYDEERYCSIKRSPMKMTKCSELDNDADRKLKEAFLSGDEATETDDSLESGAPPRPPSPDPALLSSHEEEPPPPPYNGFGDKYYTMNPQKPKTEIAEIRITSSLPHRGNKSKNKNKTVTFSPVAMVTPLPSGSEESIGSDGDRNLANVIDIYQNLQGCGRGYSPDINKGRRVVILPPTMEEQETPMFQPPADPLAMAEMEELWKSLSDTTTMDEGAYDNIEYLLAQNRQNYSNEKPTNLAETGV